ncbi:restriction endonuclease subunit S [Lactiplantibacillus plantarum]|uniref:restriction endonuclease subunit S n=1 Tax=Lactiplantibacillus plantarum TaxID=1590 RepID=UPI001432F19C|nr:restriction endonuclease subunit S [Lactiplantibacillus plantarum]
MKDNQAKYPQLRFKDFTDPWEQRKTKELCDISTGKGNTQDKVEDGKYPFYVRSATIERSNEYLYDQEAVLTVGDGVGTGKVFHYVNGKYNLHQRVYRMFNFNHGVSAKYFYHYFSKNFYRRVMSMTAKTSVDSVRMEMIADMKIKFPSPAEQETIVSVLDGVDDLISLHQRKLEKLQELKQGYLQKLFPQNGSKFPQLRFSGFADAWEERKLGELANIVRGASPRPIQDSKWFDKDSDIGWLRISDVTEQNGRIHHLEQRISKLGQEKTRVLKEPHLLLSIAATVGKPLVNYVKTGVHDGFLIFLNPSFEREFMFQWLEMFRPNWKKYGQPGSQVNLNSELVRNQEIPLPSIEEQQKIGSLFKQLDDTIALYQRKLEKLQELKKGYLQKMFC